MTAAQIIILLVFLFLGIVTFVKLLKVDGIWGLVHLGIYLTLLAALANWIVDNNQKRGKCPEYEQVQEPLYRLKQ